MEISFELLQTQLHFIKLYNIKYINTSIISLIIF